MTGDAMTGKSGLGGRVVIAGVLIVLGVGSLTAGLAGWVPEALTFVGVGALLILLGVAGASPLLGRPVTWLLGRLYRWMFGAVGQLAELNAARNPRRTAATASALMIGLALVVTMAILGQSAKSSVGGIVQTSFKGDLLVSSLMSPLAPRVGDAIAEVEGVDALYRTRRAPAQLKGETVSLIGMTPDTFGKTVDETMVSGSLTDDLDTVIVRDTWASDHDVAEGERIPLEINGLTRNVRVTGIFTAPEQSSAGSAVTNLDTLTEAGVPPLDSSYTVFVADGQPLISVDDIDSITQQATGAIDQLLAVIYALLALAIVIAVLGIVNTLALSVIERTREIGLLRAIGLTRGQLRRMVTLESVVVSVLGAVLGVGMGLVFGLALQRQLAEQGLERLDIPWPLLILFLVVSVLVGVLAAVWPARRAARLDVLQAIATE
jgi:putative ABC transport system permease protein